MELKEFCGLVIKRAILNHLDETFITRLVHACFWGNSPEIIRVLLDNHWECCCKGVYDARMFLALEDQEVLLSAGLKTQLNSPIEFQEEEVGDRVWKPFNEGASAENGVGDYFTFDEANDQATGRMVPTEKDFADLCELESEWALYQGQFGRLFDGRLFLPAGGFVDQDSGSLRFLGTVGAYWSSDMCGNKKVYFTFVDSFLSPKRFDGWNSFQLRCLAK